MKCPEAFLKELKRMYSPLDCYYNRIEERWQVIQWEGTPMNSRWFWVMTIQSPDKGRMDPDSYALDRVRWIKKIFEQDEVMQIAESEQALEESTNDKDMGNIMHELSKDLRKPLLAEFDGQVSTWNRFI